MFFPWLVNILLFFRFVSEARLVDPRYKWDTYRTASTNTAWREQEALTLFVDGRVVSYDTDRLEEKMKEILLTHHKGMNYM